MVTFAVFVQSNKSVTVMIYVPADKLDCVLDRPAPIAPDDQLNVKGGVPPEAVMVAVPFALPIQVTLEMFDTVVDIA